MTLITIIIDTVTISMCLICQMLVVFWYLIFIQALFFSGVDTANFHTYGWIETKAIVNGQSEMSILNELLQNNVYLSCNKTSLYSKIRDTIAKDRK